MRGLAMLPLLALAACNDVAPGNTVAASPSPTASAAAAPVAKGGLASSPTPGNGASEVEVETADYSFSYSYPPRAAAIPPLKAWFDSQREAARATLVEESAADRKEAQAGGFAYRPHESTTAWDVVTETPRLLSFSAAIHTYSGGAHGSPRSASLVWDKAAGKRLAAIDLFTSPAALEAAMSTAFCRELNRVRAERRGAPVTPSDDPFGKCPTLKELTLILGSRHRNAIDRIGLLADPYVAGPYAEGGYEVTLPVTAAIVKAAKPEYRGAFGIR